MVAKVPSFISAAPSPSRTKTGPPVFRATPRAMPLAPPMEPTWYKCCGRSARVKSSRPHLPVVATTAPSSGTSRRKRSNTAARVGLCAAAEKSARRPGAWDGRSNACSTASATSSLRTTKAKGRPVARIRSAASARAGPTVSVDAGKGACATPMTESRSCVIRPISAAVVRRGCRAAPPGGEQQCRDTERLIQRGQRVHGVAQARVLAHDDRLPSREPSPAAMATASPSLAAPT